jgi:hypothetical protein
VCRTTWLTRSWVFTRTPISMEVRPIRFTLAWKVMSSPTWMGSQNTT